MTDQTAGRIPDVLATAWGVRERPGKGPKPGLSVDAIVAAAIRIAATEGLPAVTMNRVASELGTAAMSLYRYLSGKEELLILMVDGASGPPPDELWAPGRDWRVGLSQWCRSLRSAYLENPWMLRIPITTPPVTPNHVAWMECALRAMSDTALAEENKVSTLLLLLGWIRADASLQADVTAGRSDTTAATIEFSQGYGAILARVTDPQRFPAIQAALQADVFGEGTGGNDDFEFGLQRILDGIELLIDADDENS